MVSKSNPEYASPSSVASSAPSAADDVIEPPIITIGENDIRVVLDKESRRVPRCERNSYKLENDPCISGRRRPTNIAFCPHCSKENVRTRTKSYPTAVTWTCVAVGAVAFFPLCWVPLVVDGLKKTDHYCQNCGQKLATIKPLQGVGVKERY